jgi:hypothetical protein
MTASTYIEQEITDIDEAFNAPGTGKKHPELVAAYMQTSAADLGSDVIAPAIETLAAAVERM